MYSNLDTAYNDNSDDLDRMARQLNKKKEDIINNEENFFEKEQEKWAKQINYFMDDKNYNKINSVDGKELNKENNKDDYSIDFSDDMSISIDSPTIDSYIDSIKSDNTKPIHKIITEINSEDCSKDSDDIYDHIKKCKECKLKLLKYITTSHTTKKSLSNVLKTNYYEDIYKKRKSLFNYFGEIENKEIVVIIMLGIFIIIILDFMMKGIKNKI